MDPDGSRSEVTFIVDLIDDNISRSELLNTFFSDLNEGVS